MYINTKKVQEFGVEKFITLVSVKQKSEYVPDLAVLQSLLADGLIRLGVNNKFVLEPKGTQILNTLVQPTKEVTEAERAMFNWLKEMYLKAGKQIGSEPKILEMIRAFQKLTNIEGNHLVILCSEYMNHNGIKGDNAKGSFSHKLENVFFKMGAYQKKYELGSSPLYQYYQTRLSFFEKKFSQVKAFNNE